MITLLKVTSVGIGAVTASVVAQADFTKTINLGAVLLAFLIVIVAGFFTLRQNLAKTQIDGWKGNFEAEKERSVILQEQIDGVRKELADAMEVIGDQKAVIVKLESLPNLERVIKLMSDTAEHQAEFSKALLQEGLDEIRTILDQQEARAEERHQALLQASKAA